MGALEDSYFVAIGMGSPAEKERVADRKRAGERAGYVWVVGHYRVNPKTRMVEKTRGYWRKVR